ncbi:hypothetical protein HYQ44_000498 [Verticillium longisporum]|nr:hypothetical protein HYQ44_000498 [Verticillium longisporum]
MPYGILQPAATSSTGRRRFVHHALFYHFVSFTPAEKWLTGAGMDATVFRDPSSSIFYRVSKNGPNNLVEQARASTLNGPWTVIRNEISTLPLPTGHLHKFDLATQCSPRLRYWNNCGREKLHCGNWHLHRWVWHSFAPNNSISPGEPPS